MINVIVAHDLNKCIGKDGKIPWNIKGEQKQFKELTTNNIVIMGRKTYDEIGKPLPNRKTIVITRRPNIPCESYNSLKKALSILLSMNDNKDIYIAGGASIYKDILENNIIVDNYYITVINQVVIGGDKFFPNFDKSLYDKTILEKTPEYTRYHYKKKVE